MLAITATLFSPPLRFSLPDMMPSAAIASLRYSRHDVITFLRFFALPRFDIAAIAYYADAAFDIIAVTCHYADFRHYYADDCITPLIR